MLFQIFKALGLDIPAQIDDLQSRIERRVERATDQAKREVREAAVTATLAAVALAAAAGAVAVGLVALYGWVAENYGGYVACGVVGAVLVGVSAVFGITAFARLRMSRPVRRGVAPMPSAVKAEVLAQASRPAMPSPARAMPIPASGWAELLTFVVPLLLKSPAMGSALGTELAASLRGGASGSANKALDGAANIVRDGDRTNLAMAVAGAMLLGWVVARRSRR